MNTKYKVLFEVDCLHEYYRDGLYKDWEIGPSAATSDLLKNAQLLSKVIDNKLIVGIKVQDSGQPLTGLPSEAKLVFYLTFASEFFTVTNLDNGGLRDGRFYFTNLNQNQSGGPPNPALNLTQAIADYDNARKYFPGDVVDDGTGTTFECVKTGSGNDPATPNSSFWISRGGAQYASRQDLLPFRSQLPSFTLNTAANAFLIKTFTLDFSTNLYQQQIREQTVVLSDTLTSNTVQADLRSVPPGRYRININGQDFDIYIDEDALAKSALAAIEIFTHLPAANAFSLFDAGGVVKETAYTLRFANRSAYWKYFTPLRKVQDILINGAHDQPSPFTSGSTDPALPNRKDFFVSNKPLLLSQVPAENLFDLKLGSDFSPAPKPDPSALGMLTQTFDTVSQTYQDFFCNIHLNY